MEVSQLFFISCTCSVFKSGGHFSKEVKKPLFQVKMMKYHPVLICVVQKAECGSVEASRAGNPEEGGSSPVGGKVCLLVGM